VKRNEIWPGFVLAGQADCPPIFDIVNGFIKSMPWRMDCNGWPCQSARFMHHKSNDYLAEIILRIIAEDAWAFMQACR